MLISRSGFLEQLDKVSHRNFIHMKAQAPGLATFTMKIFDVEDKQ
jgi:hypothetical protein